MPGLYVYIYLHTFHLHTPPSICKSLALPLKYVQHLATSLHLHSFYTATTFTWMLPLFRVGNLCVALSSPESHCVTPQITLLATSHMEQKLVLFLRTPERLWGPLYDPLLTPFELHCFSVCPQIWFGLHFVLHAPKTFPNVFNRVSDSHASFCSNISYSVSLFWHPV